MVSASLAARSGEFEPTKLRIRDTISLSLLLSHPAAAHSRDEGALDRRYTAANRRSGTAAARRASPRARAPRRGARPAAAGERPLRPELPARVPHRQRRQRRPILPRRDPVRDGDAEAARLAGGAGVQREVLWRARIMAAPATGCTAPHGHELRATAFNTWIRRLEGRRGC